VPEGLFQDLSAAVTATATVIGILLGLDIARIYEVRNRIQGILGTIRMEAYVKASIEGIRPRLAYFELERGAIAAGRTEIRNYWASGVALAAFLFSVYVAGGRPEWTGFGSITEWRLPDTIGLKAILVMQFLVFAYHTIVLLYVADEMDHLEAVPDLVLATRDQAQARAERARVTLERVFPGWNRLIDLEEVGS
jgi:hypothetical protein